MFFRCATLIWLFLKTRTANGHFILKAQTAGNVVFDDGWTSPSLSHSALNTQWVSLYTPTSPHAHGQVGDVLALGRRDPGFQRRIARGSSTRARLPTTMKTLGVHFWLVWLIWGHSCALGGKGRNIFLKGGVRGRWTTCRQNIWPLSFFFLFVFSASSFLRKLTNTAQLRHHLFVLAVLSSILLTKRRLCACDFVADQFDIKLNLVLNGTGVYFGRTYQFCWSRTHFGKEKKRPNNRRCTRENNS